MTSVPIIGVELGGFDVSGAVLLLGVFTGLSYGLLAVGLVLVYRSSRFINFAHSAIGLFAAALFAQATNVYGIPYWIAFPGGIAAGALIAAFTEKSIVRRLVGAPKVLSMVATLGLGQALIFFALSISGDSLQGTTFPKPPGFPEGDVGALFVNQAYTATAILSPLLLIGLVLFLQRSSYGVAIRGAASNPDAAATSGVDPAGMSMLSWSLAGAVAAFATMMFIPTRGAIVPDTLGPDLLLRGLAAAAIARFRSIPVAIAAALCLGVAERVLATNPDAAGWFEVLTFLAIGISVLFQAKQNRQEGDDSWDGVPLVSFLPAAYRRSAKLRRIVAAGVVVVIGLLAMVPIWASNQLSFTLISVIAFATVGLSVGLITGVGGQLSLGQFALAAIGAAVSVNVVDATGTFGLGLVAAGAVVAVVSALIGLPALRVRGLFLAVLTLSFALATNAWLLKQDWMLGSGVSPARPVFGSVTVSTARGYYLVSLATFVVLALLVRNIRRGPFGRRLVAVRDNEDAARALRVRATRTKLAAYALAGVVAGVGGAVFGHAHTQLSAAQFPLNASIDVVAVTVIGGLGALLGPVLGSIYLIGVPAVFDADTEALSVLSAAWLALIVLVPTGIVGLLQVPRERLLQWLGRFVDDDFDEEVAAGPQPPVTEKPSGTGTAPTGGATEAPVVRAGEPLLEATGLTKRFGDLVAVDDVWLSVLPGETLGLIGPNGAGKTTAFEMISGFVTPDRGTVRFDGVDVTRRSPEQRADLGLVRSFQNATLFPSMTALEAVMLAAEAEIPARLWESIVGSHRADVRRRNLAMELLDTFGVADEAERRIGELSTGTRRVVELSCAVAMRPKLLLLDEPSAGIAQADTDALIGTLRQLKAEMDLTFIVIEHDLPLLMDLADRMVALEVGTVIAEGTPEEVREHPAVVESYLGGVPA
jgi:ABC-type branched-subunit amino acid transport system ATPase component/ABC-type branched-subunit amino acid transport system permease subunit